MSDKGRRAADRRREREGDSVLGSPAGEKTDLIDVEGEWIGTASGLKGGIESAGEVPLGSDQSQVITGEHPALSSIAAESERVSAQPLEETAYAEQPRQRLT